MGSILNSHKKKVLNRTPDSSLEILTQLKTKKMNIDNYYSLYDLILSKQHKTNEEKTMVELLGELIIQKLEIELEEDVPEVQDLEDYIKEVMAKESKVKGPLPYDTYRPNPFIYPYPRFDGGEAHMPNIICSQVADWVSDFDLKGLLEKGKKVNNE